MQNGGRGGAFVGGALAVDAGEVFVVAFDGAVIGFDGFRGGHA